MFLDMYCFHVFCCSGVNVLGDVIVFCWYIDSEIVRVRNVVGVCANGVVRICGVAGYFSFACIKKVVNPVRCFEKGNNLRCGRGFHICNVIS